MRFREIAVSRVYSLSVLGDRALKITFRGHLFCALERCAQPFALVRLLEVCAPRFIDDA
jgi:hypothetical protein